MQHYDVFFLKTKSIWFSDGWSIVWHYKHSAETHGICFLFCFVFTTNSLTQTEVRRRRRAGDRASCRKIYESSCCDDAAELKGKCTSGEDARSGFLLKLHRALLLFLLLFQAASCTSSCVKSLDTKSFSIERELLLLYWRLLVSVFCLCNMLQYTESWNCLLSSLKKNRILKFPLHQFTNGKCVNYTITHFLITKLPDTASSTCHVLGMFFMISGTFDHTCISFRD